MNLQAEQSPPGANNLLYLPYLLGERSPIWNPKARGAYVGLTMQHKRSDIIRATLEGITLNLRAILDVFRENHAQVDAIRVIGGGARSRLWRQIMADIYDVPVLRPSLLEEATSLGAAVAGGVGVGLFPDFNIALSLSEVVDKALPCPEMRPVYERVYHLFNQCYEALEPLYESLTVL